jgi:ethanolamine utilization protein EutP (predicted NTPase)
VVLTKRDLMTVATAAEALDEARVWGAAHGAVDVLAISAVANDGLDRLRQVLARLYDV